MKKQILDIISKNSRYSTEDLAAMLAADAEHLATLDAWSEVLTKDQMMAIIKDFKKSKTVVRDEAKIGRNDPCPCGSGKKYKKCCGRN